MSYQSFNNNKNNKKKKKSENWRRNHNYEYEYRQENLCNNDISASTSGQNPLPEIPGFYIDPNTRKYYKIMPNIPGMVELFKISNLI